MLVEIKEKEQMQTISINGVSQNLVSKFCDVSCPNCKQILFQSQGNSIGVLKFLSVEENKDKLIKYCLNCGTKLDYPCIIEVPKN